MAEATLKHGKVLSDESTESSRRYVIEQPDGTRWSVRFYGRGNVTTREPDGRRTYRTPSLGRAYRDVSGDATVHWTELTT